jgi:inner membrane protein
LIIQPLLRLVVASYPPGTFIPIAIATHALVGLALGAVFDRPAAGLVAGVAPDADFLLPAALGWPFVHRGISHALLAVGVAAGVAAVVADRQTVVAVAVAYTSHLLIDVTTPKGIPVLYPLVTERLQFVPVVPGHAPEATVVLWLVCLGTLGYEFGARRRVIDPS